MSIDGMLRGPRIAQIVALLVILGVIAAGLAVAYRSYTERYTVETEGRDGLAVARVVRATLTDASELKVSTLRGTVQSVASDSRGFGMINSNRVMKAPFEVDYFVDLSGLGPADFRWDEASRTLLVRAPDVRIGKVNVDESRTYLDRTTGIFVTRAAMAEMQRRASAGAERVANTEAAKPERIVAAKRNARAALSALFRMPLSVAGLGDVSVEVEFVGDARRTGERWDVSRSLQEVLTNGA